MRDRYDRNSVAVQLQWRKSLFRMIFHLAVAHSLSEHLVWGRREREHIGRGQVRQPAVYFWMRFHFCSLPVCCLRMLSCIFACMHTSLLQHRDPHFKKIQTARSRFGATSTTSTVLPPTRSHPAFKGQRLVLPRFTPTRSADLHSQPSAKQGRENDALLLQLLNFIYV